MQFCKISKLRFDESQSRSAAKRALDLLFQPNLINSFEFGQKKIFLNIQQLIGQNLLK